MPTHWTYKPVAADSDLQQGDILNPSTSLESLFKEVHPHFCNAKYLAFMILTQTCDLVRRNGQCSARFINVAVIRSLADVLPSLLDTVCERVHDRTYTDKTKNRGQDLLERILNQNEQRLSLFYLYPDGDVGIGEDAVAFLRVSVAFRSDHYDQMLESRKGQLTSEFGAKLGWLVGSLYSRVGTQDWPKDKLKQLVRPHLTEQVEWVSDRAVARLKKDGVDTESLAREELLQRLKTRLPSSKEQGIKRVVAVINELMPDLSPKQIDRIRLRLTNDTALKAHFKPG